MMKRIFWKKKKIIIHSLYNIYIHIYEPQQNTYNFTRNDGNDRIVNAWGGEKKNIPKFLFLPYYILSKDKFYLIYHYKAKSLFLLDS